MVMFFLQEQFQLMLLDIVDVGGCAVPSLLIIYWVSTTMMYHIALIIRGSKFSRIAALKKFIE